MGVGAARMQVLQGVECVIAFASHKVSTGDFSRGATEPERMGFL